MSEHLATIRWQRGDADFTGGKFSRVHTWTFDGGITVEASASPSVVPAAYNSADGRRSRRSVRRLRLQLPHAHVSLLRRRSKAFMVDSYEDNAVGTMTKGENGVPWVSTVTLHPRIVYSGDKRPTPDDESHLHHDAHDKCFIANSVKSEIKVEPAK